MRILDRVLTWGRKNKVEESHRDDILRIILCHPYRVQHVFIH